MDLYFVPWPTTNCCISWELCEFVGEIRLSKSLYIRAKSKSEGGHYFNQKASKFGTSPEQAIARSLVGLLVASVQAGYFFPRLILCLIAGSDPNSEQPQVEEIREIAPKPSTQVFGVDVSEKPYLPSNGADGYEFTSRHCDRCRHDLEAGQEGCEILALALIGEQPEEWRWISGTPTCTKFELPPTKPKKPKRLKVAPGQLELF